MARRVQRLDPDARALEKRIAKSADEHALRTNRKAAREVKARNEAFASVAKLARANATRARSPS